MRACLLYCFVSKTPSPIFAYLLIYRTNTKTKHYHNEIQSMFDASDLVEEQHEAVSSDGTKVQNESIYPLVLSSLLLPC
jgi:prolyl oligopeptidase PreP (S9A serine peptidase family)